jgi:hypothetical protein
MRIRPNMVRKKELCSPSNESNTLFLYIYIYIYFSLSLSLWAKCNYYYHHLLDSHAAAAAVRKIVGTF